jgi:flagellar M-ring protein FliF
MKFKAQLNSLVENLMLLDGKKKAALATAMVVSLAAAIFFSAQFSKPLTAPLYSDLSREDLNSMSRILSENGMEFVIVTENGSIEVATAKIAQARMLLAEHGLPSSQESGYELFDRVNTLGLTSFMQGVTNKRAIEGELVRTIQMINNVNSARVHLVMEDKNVFRRNTAMPPSASVVLKTYGKISNRSINAIKHMVSAAVPGLDSSYVTIIGTDGTLMTTKDDLAGGLTKLVELEKEYERETESKIIAALGAHIGNENLRVSVTAKLNSDQKRVDETVFDPDSRVERSVQVVREADTTENKESANPTTIDQNLPDEEIAGASGQSSLENSERREELTNYEINEKKISTVSDGYSVENLSIALVVNKTRITDLLGGNASQDDINAKAQELEGIVRAAVSLSEGRGDKLMVNLVEFMPVADQLEDADNNVVMAFLAVHFGAILNTVGLVLAALLFALIGIRPIIKFLNRETTTQAISDNSENQFQIDIGPEADGNLLTSSEGNNNQNSTKEEFVGHSEGSEKWQADMDELASKEAELKNSLGGMITQSEQRAAGVIKNWLKESETEKSLKSN